MSILKKLVLGRWAMRWLMRGSPAAVAAKLAAVGLVGAWKWRRERKRELAAAAAREIPAEYEVVGPDRLAGPEPPGAPGGTLERERVHLDGIESDRSNHH